MDGPGVPSFKRIVNGMCHEGRGRGVKIFFFFPHEARLRSKDVGVCLGLNGKSKEYRFEMRRWVLTYPYPHPRPSDDLLGASYPNPDNRSADKQPLYQHAETLASPFCALCPLRLSLGGSERANPRQERSIEATLAKTNPGSTLQPPF